MDLIAVARTEARQRAEDSLAKFELAVRLDTNRWKLTPDQSRFLRNIKKGPQCGRAILSMSPVRREAQFAMIDALLGAYDTEPTVQRYFLTLAIDNWVTWERAPVINPKSIRNLAQHHIRRAGLEGFGAIELDVWANLTGEPGRRIVPHVHFIARALDSRQFQPQIIAKAMRGRRALVNTVGGASVTIKSIVKLPADAGRVAQYLLKAPVEAKNYVTLPDGTFKLWPCKFPRGSAARLLEIMSHIKLTDLLFSIGDEGRSITRSARHAVNDMINPPLRRPSYYDEREIQQVWAEIRADNGHRRFDAVRVISHT